MNCPECDSEFPIRKSLKRGKSTSRDECPECGEELEKNPPTLIEK